MRGRAQLGVLAVIASCVALPACSQASDDDVAIADQHLTGAKVDTTWGASGTASVAVKVDPPAWYEDSWGRERRAVELPDGRFVILAYETVNDVTRSVVACVDKSGKLDVSFGEGGVAKIDDVMYRLLATPSGKIVLFGGGFGAGKALRLNGDGSIDTTYYTPNLAPHRMPDGKPHGMAFQTDTMAVTQRSFLYDDPAGGHYLFSEFRRDAPGALADATVSKVDDEGVISVHSRIVHTFANKVVFSGGALYTLNTEPSYEWNSVYKYRLDEVGIMGNLSPDLTFGTKGTLVVRKTYSNQPMLPLPGGGFAVETTKHDEAHVHLEAFDASGHPATNLWNNGVFEYSGHELWAEPGSERFLAISNYWLPLDAPWSYGRYSLLGVDNAFGTVHADGNPGGDGWFTTFGFGPKSTYVVTSHGKVGGDWSLRITKLRP